MSESERKIEKCVYLCSFVRSVFINTSLSNIPMYTMGFYCLYEGLEVEEDSLGRSGYKKKYDMVKWEALANPWSLEV